MVVTVASASPRANSSVTWSPASGSRALTLNGRMFQDLRTVLPRQDTWSANHYRLINWGENLALTPLELADNSIPEKYRSLATLIKTS